MRHMRLCNVVAWSIQHTCGLQVMPGLLLGGMLPFLFSGFTMLAVGKAAGAVIEEVRWGDPMSLLILNIILVVVSCWLWTSMISSL